MQLERSGNIEVWKALPCPVIGMWEFLEYDAHKCCVNCRQRDKPELVFIDDILCATTWCQLEDSARVLVSYPFQALRRHLLRREPLHQRQAVLLRRLHSQSLQVRRSLLHVKQVTRSVLHVKYLQMQVNLNEAPGETYTHMNYNII